MKSAEGATLYHSNPVVQELNRVKGFDPLKYLKETPGGPKLDLKYKKLWFRLKYPQGRLKYSALKITEQLAIIEARVFFDKNDPEPRASFTARSDKSSAPGGMYIETAQYMAIDQALTDAGFGVQFIPNEGGTEIKTVEATPASQKVAPADIAAAETEPPKQMPPAAEKAELTEQNAQAAMTDRKPPVLEVVTPVAVVPTEPVAEEAPQIVAGGYTNDMSVEEICARMSMEEAENYIVPLGTCNGQTMKQVAQRRPASLRYYITGYSGDNNILRAAATLVSQAASLKAS